MTFPVTTVEKHNLRKVRYKHRMIQQEGLTESNKAAGQEEDLSPSQILNFDEIKINQLLDIIKIKVHYEKQMPFSNFLVKSFNQVIQREIEIAS